MYTAALLQFHSSLLVQCEDIGNVDTGGQGLRSLAEHREAESRNSGSLGFFWHLLEYFHIHPGLVSGAGHQVLHTPPGPGGDDLDRGQQLQGHLGLWPGIQGAGLGSK